MQQIGEDIDGVSGGVAAFQSQAQQIAGENTGAFSRHATLPAAKSAHHAMLVHAVRDTPGSVELMAQQGASSANLWQDQIAQTQNFIGGMLPAPEALERLAG